MDESPDIEQVTQRFALESLRQEIHRLTQILRNWVLVSAAIIIIVAAVFISYVSAVGLGALRQNTRTMSELTELSAANRGVLVALQRDLETNRLQFELIRRRLEDIETAVTPKAAARKSR